MSEITYQLYRGSKIIGSVIHTDDDFPWHNGIFEPTSDFIDVKPLFDAELKLVEDDDLEDDKWDALWTEILAPGLRLVPSSGGKEINDFLIHIDGRKTWWRD